MMVWQGLILEKFHRRLAVVSYTDIDHITTGVVGDTYRGIEMASVRTGFGKYHVRQDGLIQETARYEPGEAFPGIVP